MSQCFDVAGMIDWLSLRLDASRLSEEVREMFKHMTGRLIKINSDGEMEWECSARDNIRSDSHQINCRFGSWLEISGSPARVSDSNNVFGSLDITECALAMITFICKHYGVFITRDLSMWQCTRIDVTRNYDLGSLEQCLQAVEALKPIKVGRQKSTSHDTTCGWGYGSSLHSGKAYCKGPHLRKLVKQGRAYCSQHQLKKADRLLRLEYSIRRHLIRRIKKESHLRWNDFAPDFLIDLHDQYFSKFVTDIEVVDMENILNLLLAQVADRDGCIPTEGQARSAYDCYTRIKTVGPVIAKSTYTKPTWHRHIKNLSSIGLGYADLQQLNVVPLKRRQIVLDQPVSSWDDIKLAEGI